LISIESQTFGIDLILLMEIIHILIANHITTLKGINYF
tara:strand:- start:338 stop:451 length:114 start_codon:yes stop_codon:yes gene_type:complete